MAKTVSFSLLEFTEQVKSSLKQAFNSPVWIRAEISELHENASGHCYLEFIEKDVKSDTIIAKQKAMIWSFTYRMLKPYFESSTGTSLGVGMTVLVACQVEFHEVYGMSLNVRDIDPTFTVGDMALRRAAIVRRLTEEGMIAMNKQLRIPLLPQRIAVISSASAAGFGDFYDQLHDNVFGYKFYIKLFPAVMQGVQTEQSIIDALGKIADFQDFFDVVVIIRGGGATSDLAVFDNYNMALHCAQFPLPIISGIGHLRDDSIVDLVAHTRVKTPTAAAEFLINCLNETDRTIDSFVESLAHQIRGLLQEEKQRQNSCFMQLPHILQQTVMQANRRIELQTIGLKQVVKTLLVAQASQLEVHLKLVQLSDPMLLLRRGYTLTEKNGKIIKSVYELQMGDTIKTHFADGELSAVVVGTE